MNENKDGLAIVTEEEPKIAELQEEYSRAWSAGAGSGSAAQGEAKIARAEDVRYARWAGQSFDGLKHQELLPEGQRAMPYDRAPDTRVMLADGVIQKLVNLLYAAFWGARMKAAPASTGKLSLAQAAELRAVIGWMIHGPLAEELIDDVEFAAQVLQTIGWVVLHPCWRARQSMRMRTLDLRGIVELSQQAPEGSILEKLPELIIDPTLEDEAVQLLRAMHPNLKEARARKVVTELRTEGTASFPVESQVENRPVLRVLVPWQDFIIPPEATADPRHARVMFLREYFTEANLRTRAREEEWNEAFLDAALETAGDKREDGTSEVAMSDENARQIEIVYAFQHGVTEDGVEASYCTVFSPHVATGSKKGRVLDEKDTYGAHWLMDDAHGELPFVILRTEVASRTPGDSRGVPDVLATAQMEMKQQRDATYVFSQMSVTPPLTKKGTQASKLPPQLGPLGILNEQTGTYEWFPPPPGKPEIAFELQKIVQMEASDYFDTLMQTEGGDPATGRQRRVTRFLGKFAHAFWQLAILAYQNMRPDELELVLGRPPLLNPELIARNRIMLWFDVRAIDPGWVEQLIENVMKVLQADTAGVVDHGKLMQLILAYLDPTLAEEVTTDAAGAKQALFKNVREEIGQMMLGNEGMYTENDPTAKMKLMFADSIIKSNPDYLLQLSEKSPAFNPRKRELIDKWVKNQEQSVLQQQNKVVGRLGVAPGRNGKGEL